jgi:hypothetical protein
MRTAALVLFTFVAFCLTADAQRFSLLPQVGFENSKATISYNGLRSFAPQGVKFSPQGSLRLNYTSKQGHGFFAGVASSRSIVSFSFTDPEKGMTDFIATTGNMQLRLEGGYQFNTKPLLLKGSNKDTSKKPGQKTLTNKRSCSRTAGDRGQCIRSAAASHHCCGNKTSSSKSLQSKSKGSWVRIQPSIGMGFIPSVKTDVLAKTNSGQTMYEYRAGNWNTALIAGTAFEFGRSNNRLFTVSINYFKGIGNLGTQTINTVVGTKSVATTLQSAVSGWNMRVGIPFSLVPKMPAKVKQQQKTGCMQYRINYRCSQRN